MVPPPGRAWHDAAARVRSEGAVERVTIDRRFCGPSDSANGGYACGVTAALLEGPAEVTLRRPPPLDRALDVERAPGRVRLLDGGELIAEAVATSIDDVPPPAPTPDEAAEAATRYPWKTGHPCPICFVCGPERPLDDGLRIYPGPIAGRALAAAPFVPDASLADRDGRVRPEHVWAALDCPSWFGFHAFHHTDALALLGRLAARIDGRPRVGERCVVVGWFVEREGRKIRCGSALYDERGAPLAVGRATWVTLR